jgi:predicted transcriptional regulator
MDTQKTTVDLLASGLTQQELANLVPCSQSLINAFSKGKRGSNPTYVIANRLLELHSQRCSAQTTARQFRQQSKVPA